MTRWAPTLTLADPSTRLASQFLAYPLSVLSSFVLAASAATATTTCWPQFAQQIVHYFIFRFYREILRHTQRLANPVFYRHSRQTLLRLRQQHPDTFQVIAPRYAVAHPSQTPSPTPFSHCRTYAYTPKWLLTWLTIPTEYKRGDFFKNYS
jgi:hypothetical protein